MMSCDDVRVIELLNKVEETVGLIFVEFIDSEDGEFTDHHTKESVDSSTFVCSFWHLQQQRYVQGTLLLLHGSFSIPAANYCSGWLVFEDSEFPEIRYIRGADEAIVFTSAYTREQLIRAKERKFMNGVPD
jgi:hypothetical protein